LRKNAGFLKIQSRARIQTVLACWYKLLRQMQWMIMSLKVWESSQNETSSSNMSLKLKIKIMLRNWELWDKN